jgi:hypothetical protein
MPIQRHGPTPTFLEFILNHPLVPTDAQPSADFSCLLSSEAHWTHIPTYQRGVEWNVEMIEEMLESASVLLGTCILGCFPVSAGQFVHLPALEKEYAVLVDGLQRLSVGTCLLALLHERVLCASPTRANDAPLFRRLAVRSQAFSEIYLHNDRQLANHPRQAVRDAYRALRDLAEQYVRNKFDDATEVAKFAGNIVRLFMDRQVAVDLYVNFSSATDLANTFIGINTVRIDLGPVDLLRSYIVEQAFRARWSASAIEDTENRFTDLFTEAEQPIRELEPFVAVVLNELTERGRNPANVFPSWASGLLQTEVDDFLDCLDRVYRATDLGNGFLKEIRAVGAIPLAGLLAFYYRGYLQTHNLPSFVSGGSSECPALHRFLCGNLRALLAGKIGRTRDDAASLLTGQHTTLEAAADAIATRYTGRPVTAALDSDWLVSALRAADKGRAPRVFNAVRLPDKALGWGAAFVPDVYGSSSQQYHVDHLIPKSVIQSTQPGARECEMLVNFAPLPSTHNRVAKATPCSAKLAPNALYDNYVRATPTAHPYCQWLVTTQGTLASDLDRQELLEWNQAQRIPDERVEWLAERLASRL